VDFFETIQRRRSFRKFTTLPVPAEVMQKAFDAAFLAPNSSNLQPWEFYWVRSDNVKKQLVQAALSQGAAASAQELVVAVSRTDTWSRNRDLIVEYMHTQGLVAPSTLHYYQKLIPWAYCTHMWVSLGKKIYLTVQGFFKPTPRGPCSKKDLFEVVTKSTALACENFMLALAAQGFDSCPMEGFDEVRIKQLLGLPCHSSHVVMVLGVGQGSPEGLYGARYRVPKELVLKII
jgi:nitroreductase